MPVIYASPIRVSRSWIGLFEVHLNWRVLCCKTYNLEGRTGRVGQTGQIKTDINETLTTDNAQISSSINYINCNTRLLM